jgi:flagella basal body P-ring formation protein FlgA
VTLSDLFEGATGAAGQVVVGRAAPAGMNTVLEAGQVQMAAQRAGLVWDNPQGLRRLLVGSTGDGVTSPERTTTASAASAGRAGARPQVLAYARNINTGEIIQPSDLVWSDEVIAAANAPNDPNRLIGQAARHPLRGGAAVQANDLAAAAVVHRDEMIEVVFEAPGISLVLQGKAMKDAAVGEQVQVLNPQSKKVIEAVASAPGRAVVGPRADVLKAAPFITASLR